MKYLYAGIAGLLIAVLIFWAGMSYNQYKISHSPEVISIDTTNHSLDIPLKDTVHIPVTVYKPDKNRQKYIDSLLVERITVDSLRNFIVTKLSMFGEVFTDSVEQKNSLGTFKQIHIFDILADPLYCSIQKTDIKNHVEYTSYDTTKSTYTTEEPTIWKRLHDIVIFDGIIAVLYFLFSAL